MSEQSVKVMISTAMGFWDRQSILGNNNTPTVQIQQLLRHRRLATTERYIRALQPLRPYLKALEGGGSTKRSNNGSNSNEKGLRAITS